MNKAARTMLERDPLISLTTLRFFKLAGVSRAQFLAGFRERTYNCGVEHEDRLNVSYLCAFTSDFIFIESDWLAPEFEGAHHAILTLDQQSIPETVLTAPVGRPLTDLIGGGRQRFFLSRHTCILAAAAVSEDNGPALELVLGDKWMPLSRFLKLL